jgi:porphobilinogen deaminase
VTIRTTGDRVQDRLLAEIGGKGLFAKEIEDELIAGHIDLPVHSLKDLETWLPAGLAIACVLPRDAFLSPKAQASRPYRRSEDQDGFVAAPGPIDAVTPRSDDPSDPRQCEHADPQAGFRRGRCAGARAVRPRTARQDRACDRHPVVRNHAPCGGPGRAMLAALDGSCRTPRLLGSKARRLNPKGTQEEVARAAGVSRATVSRIERGDRRGGGRLLTPQF